MAFSDSPFGRSDEGEGDQIQQFQSQQARHGLQHNVEIISV
jgi:hypothetical protein